MHFNKILVFVAFYGFLAVQAKSSSFFTGWELGEALSILDGVRTFNGTWITDDEFFYIARDKSIHIYNADRNIDMVAVEREHTRLYGGYRTYEFSYDNTKILVGYDIDDYTDYYSEAAYDIFDTVIQKYRSVHNGRKLQYCIWSPTRNELAYVLQYNVYMYDYSNDRMRKLTSDGSPFMLNGIPDWMYAGQILYSDNALFWSNDGNYLAAGVFDDTKVKTFATDQYHYGNRTLRRYEKLLFRYAKPGTTIPSVHFRVFNVSDPYKFNKILTSDIPGYDIVKSVTWTKDNKLLIIWLNRHQNSAILNLCGVAGDCKKVRSFEESKGWINIGKPLCLRYSENCLFTYWIDNWLQIWNLNLTSGDNLWTSRGNFTVLKLYGYDEINDKIYYQATLSTYPSEVHVFINDHCLSCTLTEHLRPICESADAVFSKDYSFYAITCKGPEPPFTKIYRTMDNIPTNWELNYDFMRKVEKKIIPITHIENITLPDGSLGMFKVLVPPSPSPYEKFAMIVEVNGSPNSVIVNHDYQVGFEHYLCTSLEVIYVKIDGRGTGNKDKDTLFSVNEHLGEFEVEDIIYVTKYIQNEIPFVDKDRCGIWGWGYGGYLAARTLISDTERIFKYAILGAPITSWMYHNAFFTERYMDLPCLNFQKYLETSVFNNITNFRNRNFMLIHGSSDYHIHYQHSAMLAKALQRNDILFEQVIYNDDFLIKTKIHTSVYKIMDKFWTEAMNLKSRKYR